MLLYSYAGLTIKIDLQNKVEAASNISFILSLVLMCGVVACVQPFYGS